MALYVHHPLRKCRDLMCGILRKLTRDRRQKAVPPHLQQTQRPPRSIFGVILSAVLRGRGIKNRLFVTGGLGEKHAARFLRDQGYRIIKRNFRCTMSEIDLVALDGDMIVFVEVKTRSDRKHADPQDAVDIGKQRRLTRGAKAFLAQTKSQNRPCRFDIVAITLDGKKPMEIEHIKDAFEPRF